VEKPEVREARGPVGHELVAGSSPSTKLECYALHEYVPKLVPARMQREWMDEFPDRRAEQGNRSIPRRFFGLSNPPKTIVCSADLLHT
jgi:hypothetical protein